MNSAALQQQYPPIIANAGLLLLEGLISSDYFAALQQECMHSHAVAVEQQTSKQTSAGYREGSPARWLLTAEGGPVQTSLYHDPVLLQHLSAYCGRPVAPTGQTGSYSYYDAPGHFLGLHRDITGCDTALITCLYRDKWATESGSLRVYYKKFGSKLDEVDQQSSNCWDIDMQTGQSILLLGGWIPHEVLPSAAGHKRYISVLCFAFASGADA